MYNIILLIFYTILSISVSSANNIYDYDDDDGATIESSHQQLSFDAVIKRELDEIGLALDVLPCELSIVEESESPMSNSSISNTCSSISGRKNSTRFSSNSSNSSSLSFDDIVDDMIHDLILDVYKIVSTYNYTDTSNETLHNDTVVDQQQEDQFFLSLEQNITSLHEMKYTSLQNLTHEMELIEAAEKELQELSSSESKSTFNSTQHDEQQQVDSHEIIRDEHDTYDAYDPSLIMTSNSSSTDKNWKEAGYEIIHPNIPLKDGLDLIRDLNLKTFILRQDKKKELFVSSNKRKKQIMHSQSDESDHVSLNERRTRRHTGVIDFDINKYFQMGDSNHTANTNTEPSSSLFFSYNLKAIQALNSKTQLLQKKQINLHDELSAKVQQRIAVLMNQTQTNDDDMNNTFKSILEQIAETTFMETQASLIYSQVLYNRIVHLTNMTLELFQLKSDSQLSSQRNLHQMNLTESQKKYDAQLDTFQIHTEAQMDVVIELIQTIIQMEALKNETYREILLMKEKANHEMNVTLTKIISDTQKERQNESKSLAEIQRLGKEAILEMRQTILLIKDNLIDGVQFLFLSRNGNIQFLWIVGYGSLMSFLVNFIMGCIDLILYFVMFLLFKPKLVREYSNGRRRRSSLKQDKVILKPEIKDRISQICKTISIIQQRQRQRNNGLIMRFLFPSSIPLKPPMKNILLCGPPGCGKTMVARYLAASANGIPYAIMSGGDIAPLGREGPLELRNLLTWACGGKSSNNNNEKNEKSRSKSRGTILIIDEAESAFGSRLRKKGNTTESNNQHMKQLSSLGKDTSSSGYALDALNVMLSMTGSASSELMLILTTSSPSSLDEAILDRMDEIIDLGLPGEKERYHILFNEFYKHFKEKIDDDHNANNLLQFIWKRLCNCCRRRRKHLLVVDKQFNVKKALFKLAQDVDGFSGRELKTIITTIVAEIYVTKDREKDCACVLLSEVDWKQITTRAVNDIKDKKNIMYNSNK